MERRPQTTNDVVPRQISGAKPPARKSQEETQPCPCCGHTMPALKGGSASICPNCGFKDSCCY